MFGLMGWAGIPIGAAVVIGPVLVAGLSIDYGFHVFMQYRERCGAEETIKPPVRRAVRALALAFGLHERPRDAGLRRDDAAYRDRM